MLDPHLETLTFAVFAILIGVVIFGGTTLAYFLDQRRQDPPRRSWAVSPTSRSRGPGRRGRP